MKTNKPASIDEYISGFSEKIQVRIFQIREVIKKAYPEVEETIRYSIPAFKLGKEHVYIAAYKTHIGMYPMYGLNGLENEMAIYRGKGTMDSLHFPHSKPLPLELIKKIVLEKSSEE